MATGGQFLFRRLEQLLPGVLGRRYRALMFESGEIVPTIGDLQAGASEVVRDTVTEVGDAAIVSDGAFDIPIVDLSADEDRYRVLMLAAGMSWTFQQMRAMEKAGNAQFITNRKMMLANRVIAEKANKIGAFGNSALGLTGALNNASVTVNDSSFNPYTATPDALAEFFIDELGAVVASTNAVEYPDSVGVSIELEFLLIGTRMPDGSTSVMKHILDNSRYISKIVGLPECNFANLEANGVLAGGTNKDRIIMMPMDPEVIERHVETTQVAPSEYHEVKALRHCVPMFQCVTPTIVNYPGALRYIDVNKKP